jgi:hypothetical protein
METDVRQFCDEALVPDFYTILRVIRFGFPADLFGFCQIFKVAHGPFELTMDWRKAMGKLSKSLILGFFLVLMVRPSLQAQTELPAPATAPAADPAPTGQAPSEVLKKLSDLIHSGKYVDAQQLAAGLLLAYPDDQRLIRAKALLDKAVSSSQPADNGTSARQSANRLAPTAAGVKATPLTGMDKVEYNSLIERARQAQQTTDLGQQKILLQEFMTESRPFAQQHQDDILIWQLRAAAALSLNEPIEGYEAGQELLSAGAADSNDPNLQHLMAQLNLEGWLDHKRAELREQEKAFEWLLGTWTATWDWWWGEVHGRDQEQFVVTDSGIEGYLIAGDAVRNADPDFRGKMLDSGEIQWECYMPPADSGAMFVFRRAGGGLFPKVTIGRRSDPQGYYAGNLHHFGYDPHSTDTGAKEFYPSGWQPVSSYKLSSDKRTMTVVILPQDFEPESKFSTRFPVTLVFKKAGGAQDQQLQSQQLPH